MEFYFYFPFFLIQGYVISCILSDYLFFHLFVNNVQKILKRLWWDLLPQETEWTFTKISAYAGYCAGTKREWSIVDISPFEAMVKIRLLRCLLQAPCWSILSHRFKWEINQCIAKHATSLIMWWFFARYELWPKITYSLVVDWSWKTFWM